MTSPASLMSYASPAQPPSVGKARTPVLRPACVSHTTADRHPLRGKLNPTTCPEALTSCATLPNPSGSVPRSSMIQLLPDLVQSTAWFGPAKRFANAYRATCPTSFTPQATVGPPPGMVPSSSTASTSTAPAPLTEIDHRTARCVVASAT